MLQKSIGFMLGRIHFENLINYSPFLKFNMQYIYMNKFLNDCTNTDTNIQNCSVRVFMLFVQMHMSFILSFHFYLQNKIKQASIKIIKKYIPEYFWNRNNFS